ncbi:hypothetical protein [Paenibacillus ginsengarvi]|uniref:Uncharacterized protein n=1 Tax=Paenibacillus ginsengarvi TaxID=400777 RepID=A0A3B0CEZ5_9BACL|nr:hypothetical protein [Paenibacillus ginsengarvi]RKN83910.1 hypothetical protein D7M11_15100 [Paenibacillus ginsengarvi]
MSEDNRRFTNRPGQRRSEESGRQEAGGSGWNGESAGPEYEAAVYEDNVKRKASKKNVHRFWFGISALALIGASITFGNASSASIKDVRANGTGAAKAGAVLLASDDDAGLEPRDFEVAMKPGMQTSRALLWDFAAEDGDVVTVKVNGSVIAENVTIFHKPFVLDIPIPSTVEIVGVKDGGGGITYAVKFPGAVSGSAYFNAAGVGSSNVYTITGQ